MRTRILVLFALLASGVPPRSVASSEEAAQESRSETTPHPFLLHVKTSLGVDDAQICVFPNVAWAALEAGHPVTVFVDGSAVTSVAKGFGWRGWLGIDSTAMDRAPLPDRERRSLSEQLGAPLESVPKDYGTYLHLLKEKGVTLYYNRTMALLYRIDPERIDPALQPLGLKEMVDLLSGPAVYLVY